MYVCGGGITGNTLVNSNVAAIRFPVRSYGILVSNNIIKDMTGTIVAAITIEDTNNSITIDSNTFIRSTGNYVAFHFSAANITLSANQKFFGSMIKFSPGSEGNITDGTWLFQ